MRLFLFDQKRRTTCGFVCGENEEVNILCRTELNGASIRLAELPMLSEEIQQ
jgi:hypothetical protein